MRPRRTGAAHHPSLARWSAEPDAREIRGNRKKITFYGGATPTRLSDITDPTITIYRPEKPSGTAVVVAPGGGFMLLSYSFEGTQVCEWLNSIGVTAVLLKYRTPTRDDTAPARAKLALGGTQEVSVHIRPHLEKTD